MHCDRKFHKPQSARKKPVIERYINDTIDEKFKNRNMLLYTSKHRFSKTKNKKQRSHHWKCQDLYPNRGREGPKAGSRGLLGSACLFLNLCVAYKVICLIIFYGLQSLSHTPTFGTLYVCNVSIYLNILNEIMQTWYGIKDFKGRWVKQHASVLFYNKNYKSQKDHTIVFSDEQFCPWKDMGEARL